MQDYRKFKVSGDSGKPDAESRMIPNGIPG
jgi:hypothetical protein